MHVYYLAVSVHQESRHSEMNWCSVTGSCINEEIWLVYTTPAWKNQNLRKEKKQIPKTATVKK